MATVTQVNVLAGNSSNIQMPAPWQKIGIDLNEDAGGAFIYLFFKKGNGTPITGLTILQGNPPQVPAGYAWDDTDLNKGAGGAFLYFAWTRNTSLAPIQDISVVIGGSKQEAVNQKPPGWKIIDVDLNKGSGGKFLYVVYRQ